MKIVTILGARPQMIKASVVSAEMTRRGVDEAIIHTGQHFDDNMSSVFFSEMGVPEPVKNLGIGGGSHGRNTGRMLEQLETELERQAPDWVLVYGDTDSTLAGALAAAKLHIPIAHVEAGLRSFNRRMPEEINRVVTDHVATALFAPTDRAIECLRNEGMHDDCVVMSGDVMFDVALRYGRISDEQSTIIEKLGLTGNDYTLATIHRAENTDDVQRLEAIFGGFRNLPRKFVLPLHPRTKNRIASAGIALPSNLKVIDPVGYLDMIALEKGAQLIVTDSGGVQKEAFFHGIPCVTLRDETEWTELVDMGWNRLVSPTSAEAVAEAIRQADSVARKDEQPYGTGQASQIIVESLLNW